MHTDLLIAALAIVTAVACIFALIIRSNHRRLERLQAERAEFESQRWADLRKPVDPGVKIPRPVRLTRHQLMRLNIQRRNAGRLMLSARGIETAIRAAPDRVAPSSSSNDWLLYLMLYEAMNSDHTTRYDDIGTGVEITPGGGTFGGAGASGAWTDTSSPVHDDPGAGGPSWTDSHPDTLSADKASAQEWSSPDPSPTNHSDDSSSSTSSDSSSSSSSGSSSSSSDSGSSSSSSSGDSGGGSSGGGGDSGGGGGGGGGSD